MLIQVECSVSFPTRGALLTDGLDSVGSVAFHPHHPILLSVSGSRHYGDVDSDGDSSDDSDENKEVRIRSQRRLQPVATDSSIKTWNFQPKSTLLHEATDEQTDAPKSLHHPNTR